MKAGEKNPTNVIDKLGKGGWGGGIHMKNACSVGLRFKKRKKREKKKNTKTNPPPPTPAQLLPRKSPWIAKKKKKKKTGVSGQQMCVSVVARAGNP